MYYIVQTGRLVPRLGQDPLLWVMKLPGTSKHAINMHQYIVTLGLTFRANEITHSGAA